ncbi:DUF1761 domain-containing protein [Rhodococcus ruber]|uniref:DUF1761 domain-containing protein n=1 Tax=Rhodococcus ruber TaxID=1830 RepID=A0ABT4MGA6_9NOCA|nr:DUF1761 domain-containing protein [Rhodococcus ruber]MCZ4520022.1 DUF1761 domain-containing protein [Rhodococcus ruber]
MELDWLGVVLAIVAGMGVAGIWYGKVFVAPWWQLTGITPQQSKNAGTRNMMQLLVANSITAVGLATAISVAFTAFGNESVWVALLVGLVAWMAFSATTLLQHNAFELKPPKLTLINCSYQLVLFLAMSLVIWLV